VRDGAYAVPATKNYASEVSTLGILAGVNPLHVQWAGLTLEEPPIWSRLTSTPGKYAGKPFPMPLYAVHCPLDPGIKTMTSVLFFQLTIRYFTPGRTHASTALGRKFLGRTAWCKPFPGCVCLAKTGERLDEHSPTSSTHHLPDLMDQCSFHVRSGVRIPIRR